jgi:predicted nucleic acid-binding protein
MNFADTVGLIALWDESDQWHLPAEEAYRRAIRSKARLVTTAPVLFECGNAASRRPYRDAVDELRLSLERHQAVIHPNESDWHEAWQAYRRRMNSAAGVVDQISFVVMRRLGIIQAFTNDQHFRAAGFETLF